MPAALTVPKILARLSRGLDDQPIESTTQHEEAARQLDYLKGSTSHWSQTDARFTQQVDGVAVLQARDRIRAKLRAAVAQGKASCRSKRQKALSDAAELADAHEKSVEASKRKNERVLRAVARLLEEKDIIASSAVVAQHDNLQLAKQMHAGEPDEELLDEAEDMEPAEAAAAGSAVPLPKRRKRGSAAPLHAAEADRILEKAVNIGEQKALMCAAKVAAGRCGQNTNGAALKTLLRRLCKHSEQEARQLEEQVDACTATVSVDSGGKLLQPLDAAGTTHSPSDPHSDDLCVPYKNPALAQSTEGEARAAAHKQVQETNCEMLCEPR